MVIKGLQRTKFSLSVALLLALPQGARAQGEPGTIADIAVGNPDFSTLVTALQAAGLVETLNGPGPFTVFAPTDAALANLPDGNLDALLADPDSLRKVLLYHMVNGRVRSTDLVSGKVVTLQGAAATVDLSTGVQIDGANVVAADVEASNGVIHVIDTVLLPPPNIMELALTEPEFSTLVTAVQTAGLVDLASGIWQPLDITPTTADGVSKVELDAIGGGQFFRVRNEP